MVRFLLLAGLTLLASSASAQINEPGRHPRYTVELEPLLVWQWNGAEAAVDDGLGIGLRASIPVLQDGPVSTINNNLAVTFGLQWAHFFECRGADDCSENDFWVPAALQWNFFLTPMLSIFPEFGLGFRHAVFTDPVCVNGGRCRTTSLEVHPVLWFGGRFRLTDKIAIVMRLGTPSLHFGVSFLL